MSSPYTYQALDTTIPTWNGGCGFNDDEDIDYSDCEGEDKFRVMKIKMYAEIGTHIDAPSHCIPGGIFIHDFDVNNLIMSCVVLDISDQCHERYSLSAQDIAGFESKYMALLTK